MADSKKVLTTKQAKAKIERSGPKSPAQKPNESPNTQAETMIEQGSEYRGPNFTPGS